MACDQPIEQVADRSEPLLDARRGELARAGLDPGGDMHRLHGADRRYASARAPGQEFIGSAGVGPPRVRVADVGRKEFQEANAGALAGGSDERRRSEKRGSSGNQSLHNAPAFGGSALTSGGALTNLVS